MTWSAILEMLSEQVEKLLALRIRSIGLLECTPFADNVFSAVRTNKTFVSWALEPRLAGFDLVKEVRVPV